MQYFIEYQWFAIKLVQIKKSDKSKVSNYLKQAARLKGHKNIKGWIKQRSIQLKSIVSQKSIII